MLKAKNLNQLKKELKEIEGKAIFKLIRINSMNDGEFFRVLHKIKNDKIIFWTGEEESSLYFPPAKEIQFINNGFIVGNCTYELLKVR